MIEVEASQEAEASETEGKERREEEEALEIEVEVHHEVGEALETEVAGLHEVAALHQEDGVGTELCQNERASCAYARRLGIPTGDWVQAGCNMKSTTMSIRAC